MASRSSGKEGDEGRGLDADAWVPDEPFSQAHHIKRHGGQDVLQMRPGLAPVPRSAQVAGTDPLRDGPLDARVYGVSLLELVRLLTVPRRLYGIASRLRAQEELPRMPLGAGAERTAGAGRAGLVVEAHPDDWVVRIGRVQPADTGLSALWYTSASPRHPSASPRHPLPCRKQTILLQRRGDTRLLTRPA